MLHSSSVLQPRENNNFFYNNPNIILNYQQADEFSSWMVASLCFPRNRTEVAEAEWSHGDGSVLSVVAWGSGLMAAFWSLSLCSFSLSVHCVSLTALTSVTIGGFLCSWDWLKIKPVLLICFVGAGLCHPTREGAVMSCNLFDGNLEPCWPWAVLVLVESKPRERETWK